MALSKYLDPKNDIAFKKIFGTEKNKDILIHFLNDILNFSQENQIEDIQFLSPVQNPDIAAKKQSIVDVLCTDKQGIKYIIEMQVARYKGFEKRAQYYAARVYGSQANSGDKYYNLKEIIFIAIANCEIFPNKADYKSDHVILDRKTHEHDLKDFYFTFIELPKFHKRKEELVTIEDKWCYFFKHAHETTEQDLQKIVGTDEVIRRAYAELDKFYWTEQELLVYEEIKKIDMDNMAVMDQKIYEAEVRGESRGEARGIEKGVQKGKIEVAKNLLRNGMEINLVVQATGLSEDQIKQALEASSD